MFARFTVILAFLACSYAIPPPQYSGSLSKTLEKYRGFYGQQFGQQLLSRSQIPARSQPTFNPAAATAAGAAYNFSPSSSSPHFGAQSTGYQPTSQAYGGQQQASPGYGGQPQAFSGYGGQQQAFSGYGGQPQAFSGYGGQPQAFSGYGGQPQAPGGKGSSLLSSTYNYNDPSSKIASQILFSNSRSFPGFGYVGQGFGVAAGGQSASANSNYGASSQIPGYPKASATPTFTAAGAARKYPGSTSPNGFPYAQPAFLGQGQFAAANPAAAAAPSASFFRYPAGPGQFPGLNAAGQPAASAPGAGPQQSAISPAFNFPKGTAPTAQAGASSSFYYPQTAGYTGAATGAQPTAGSSFAYPSAGYTGKSIGAQPGAQTYPYTGQTKGIAGAFPGAANSAYFGSSTAGKPRRRSAKTTLTEDFVKNPDSLQAMEK